MTPHVVIAEGGLVSSAMAQDHAHVLCLPGWTKAQWMQAVQDTVGPNFAEIPCYYGVNEDGSEEFIFYFDPNTTPKEAF